MTFFSGCTVVTLLSTVCRSQTPFVAKLNFVSLGLTFRVILHSHSIVKCNKLVHMWQMLMIGNICQVNAVDSYFDVFFCWYCMLNIASKCINDTATGKAFVRWQPQFQTKFDMCIKKNICRWNSKKNISKCQKWQLVLIVVARKAILLPLLAFLLHYHHSVFTGTWRYIFCPCP